MCDPNNQTTTAAPADFNSLGQVLSGELTRRAKQQEHENMLHTAMQLLVPQPPGRQPRAPMNGFGNGMNGYNHNGNTNGNFNSGYGNVKECWFCEGLANDPPTLSHNARQCPMRIKAIAQAKVEKGSSGGEGTERMAALEENLNRLASTVQSALEKPPEAKAPTKRASEPIAPTRTKRARIVDDDDSDDDPPDTNKGLAEEVRKLRKTVTTMEKDLRQCKLAVNGCEELYTATDEHEKLAVEHTKVSKLTCKLAVDVKATKAKLAQVDINENACKVLEKRIAAHEADVKMHKAGTAVTRGEVTTMRNEMARAATEIERQAGLLKNMFSQLKRHQEGLEEVQNVLMQLNEGQAAHDERMNEHEVGITRACDSIHVLQQARMLQQASTPPKPPTSGGRGKGSGGGRGSGRGRTASPKAPPPPKTKTPPPPPRLEEPEVVDETEEVAEVRSLDALLNESDNDEKKDDAGGDDDSATSSIQMQTEPAAAEAQARAPATTKNATRAKTTASGKQRAPPSANTRKKAWCDSETE